VKFQTLYNIIRLIINTVLLLVIVALVYLFVTNITAPIEFNNEKSKRENAVVEQLKKVRNAQLIYKTIENKYASDFDSLKYVLKNGRIPIIQVTDDPSDPTGESYLYDTLYFSAADSMATLGINIDSLDKVPYGRGASFEIQADTMTYQSTLVDVLQVGVKRKVFMGPYADPKYARYDKSYDPNSMIKFGNLNAPNTSGNWGER
jgi:hypothetical protein